MNQSSAERNPVEELAEEFLYRYRQGERPSINDYASQHPDLAEEIREVFPALAVLEEAGIGKPPSGQDPFDTAPMPRRLDDYRLVRELRRGGMATVYEAVQESLSRRVALKVLPWGASHDPVRVERFRREARAAANLHHTNIVPVFEVGEHLGVFFYAMQYIQGQALDEVLVEVRRLRRKETRLPPGDGEGAEATPLTLASALQSGRFAPAEGHATLLTALDERPPPLFVPEDEGFRPESTPPRNAGQGRPTGDAPPERSGASSSGFSLQSRGQYYRSVARVGLQVAEALAYAHDQKVLHRDIKPSNLLLDVRGAVWVTDFGLVKDSGDDLTRTGDVVGTLRYMPPERFTGGSDARGDVYGLGVTLYELLALRPAFDESDQARLVRQVNEYEPPAPSKFDAHVPRDLETIVRKAMAKRPSDRYASAAAMADDLRRFLDGKPVRARRSSAIELAWRWCRRNRLAASLLLLLAVVAGLGFSGVSWKWREAENARQSERAARDDADQQAQRRRQAFDDLLAAQRLLERGTKAADERSWDDAFLAFSRAIELRPEHQGAWDARGLLYARLGLWDRVRHDWSRAFDLRAPELGWKWILLGLMHLEAGDRESYLRLCDRMRRRFRGTLDATAAMENVWLSMALPDPSADPREMAELAETIASNHPRLAWFQYVAGLAEHRAGHARRAVECFRRSREVDPSWAGRDGILPMLALAHHELGSAKEAAEALAAADASYDHWVTTMFELPDDIGWAVHGQAEPRLPMAWCDWLKFRADHRRAHLALRGATPPDDVRLDVLRARALAALGDKTEADAIFSAALKLRPDDPEIRLEAHLNRAYLAIWRKDWRRTADEFAMASELRPTVARLWSFRVPARLVAGQVEAYREDCRAMFARFASTDDRSVANELVRACVVGPEALPDMACLLPVARLAATWHHGNVRLVGAALYRAGEYQQAMHCMAESDRLLRPSAWEYCFRAMIHQRLGNRDEARRFLAEAEAWIAAANQRLGDDITGDGPSWYGEGQFIETYALLPEARKVVSGTLSRADADGGPRRGE